MSAWSCQFSASVGIPYSPALNPSTLTRDELIQYYSRAGFSTSVIRRFLSGVHGHHISERHIRRIRKRLDVSSNTPEAPIPTVCAAIRVSHASCNSYLIGMVMWDGGTLLIAVGQRYSLPPYTIPISYINIIFIYLFILLNIICQL